MKLRKFSINEEADEISFSLYFSKHSKVCISNVFPRSTGSILITRMREAFCGFMQRDSQDNLVGFSIKPPKKGQESDADLISFQYTNGQNSLLVYNNTEYISMYFLTYDQEQEFERVNNEESDDEAEAAIRKAAANTSARLYYFSKLCYLYKELNYFLANRIFLDQSETR
jgi:hypothetical protein